MRKKIFLLGSLLLNALLVVLLFVSYGKQKNQTVYSLSDTSQFLKTSNHYPFKDAEKDVKYYVDQVAGRDTIRKQGFVRAFTISAIDMLEVLGLDTTQVKTCKYRECRAYLGLNKDKDTFKLFLTPIKDGKDIFLRHGGDPSRVIDTSSYVLDLIAPCPKTCDAASPLYKFR